MENRVGILEKDLTVALLILSRQYLNRQFLVLCLSVVLDGVEVRFDRAVTSSIRRATTGKRVTLRRRIRQGQIESPHD